MPYKNSQLEECVEEHTPKSYEGKCCKHIRAVLGAMVKNDVEPTGDLQVCGLQCNHCKDKNGRKVFHGF